VANEIVNNPMYQQSIDPIDFAFLSESHLSLIPPSGVTPVAVDEGSGLPLPLDVFLGSERAGITLYAYGHREASFFKPQRFFAPYELEADNQTLGDHYERIGD